MEYTQFASIAGVHPPGFSSGYLIGCAAVVIILLIEFVVLVCSS
jgi:hypothetical protein